MSYVVGMNNTEELNTILQREVGELHQTIGGLIARIESLEKQKECLIKVGVDKSSKIHEMRFSDSLPKFSDVARDTLRQDAQFDEACLQADIRSDD